MLKKAKDYCKGNAKTTAGKVTGGTVGLATLLTLILGFVNRQDDHLSASMLTKESRLYETMSDNKSNMYLYVNSTHANLIRDVVDVRQAIKETRKEYRNIRRDIQGLQTLILDLHTKD